MQKEFYYYLSAPLQERLGFKDPVTRKKWHIETWSWRKVATVCIVTRRDEYGNQEHARGLAICSLKDQFSRKIGRAIAKGRALIALNKRTTCGKWMPWPYSTEQPYQARYKAEYMPIWTPAESRMIDKFLPAAYPAECRDIIPIQEAEKYPF